MDNPEQRDQYLVGYNDLKIYTHHWAVADPKAVIIIVHGFGENCRRYDHVAAYFNNQHISCVGIDLYGHGQTEGLKGHADRYDLFLDLLDQFSVEVKSQYSGIPFFIYAHSMGGNIVLNYLFRRKPEANGIVVTGSWIDLALPAPKIKVLAGKLLRNILPKMRQASELRENLLSTDQSVGRAYVADPLVNSKLSNALGIDVLTAADYLRTFEGETFVPLLIMHGEDDQIIAHQPSIDLASRLKGDVRLKIWPKMYHEIHNEHGKEEVFAHTYNWIKNYI